MDASQKRYLSGDEVLLDSFRLARQIYDSRWDPDLLVILWRGGAPVGLAIHEFFVYKGLRKEHLPVKCSSYAGLRQAQPPEISLAPQQLERIRPGQRVLIVDDIFDTGLTAGRMREIVAARGAESRVATLFWKPSRNCTADRPDYYLHATDQWVVFPHELDGLTRDEVRRKSPEIEALLRDATAPRPAAAGR